MFDEIFHSVTGIGLWSGPNRNGIHLIAKCSILCYLGIFILQLGALVHAKDNLEDLIESSSVTFSCTMGLIKLYTLLFKRSTWITLLEQIKQLEEQDSQYTSKFEYDSDDEGQPDLTSVKLKNKHEEKFKTTHIMLQRHYRISSIFFIGVPFVEYGIRLLLGYRPSNYPHILLFVWTPFDYGHVVWYIFMVIIEIVAAIYVYLVHVSFDLTFVGITTFVHAHCNILFDQCTRIGGTGRDCVLSKKRDERAHARICRAHKTYISLVNIVSTLDSLCKNIFGTYFLIAIMTLCCNALRLKLESLNTMQLARLIQYICSSTIQLFLCCIFGDKVLNGSSISMGEGPFGAAIWCLSPRIRREIVLLGVAMSQQRQLSAGPFNTLDLPSFLLIIRAAYSYYTVVGERKPDQ